MVCCIGSRDFQELERKLELSAGEDNENERVSDLKYRTLMQGMITNFFEDIIVVPQAIEYL